MSERGLSQESRYAYLFGMVKHLETKLITRDGFEKLLNSKDSGDAIRILGEMGYGAFADGGEDVASNVESAIMAELRRTYLLLIPAVPDRDYLDLFFIEYDIHNLKVLLKHVLGQEPAGDGGALLDVGTLEKKAFATLLAVKPDAVPAAFPIYSEDIKTIVSAHADTGDISIVDSVLDSALYRRMGELAAGNVSLVELVAMQADMGNMKLLMRAGGLGRDRGMLHFIPSGTMTEAEFRTLHQKGADGILSHFAHRYGKIVPPAIDYHRSTGSWLYLEKYLADAIINKSRASNYIMGPEVLAGYVLAKKQEARTLGAILISKINGMPVDRMRAVCSV